MRFNCENCGAKYQIADEKVAGKTVRMKCRKCGNLIQVRAEAGPGGVAPVHMAPTPRPSTPHPVRPMGGPPPPRPSGMGAGPPPSTPRPSRPGPIPAPRPSGPGAKGLAASPSGAFAPPRPAPPRPSGVGRAPPRPAPRPGVAAPVARSSAVAGQAAAARLEPLTSEQPLPEEEGESATVVMMRQSVEEALAPRPAAGAPPSVEPTTTPRGPQLSTKVEWYVGIDGEPVGPVDQVYIQSQIDAGKVTSASLVWREQMADWQPLNSVPEMRALLSAKSTPKAPADQASDPIALHHKHEAGAAPEPPASAPATRPSVTSAPSDAAARAPEPAAPGATALGTSPPAAAIAKTELGEPAAAPSIEPAPEAPRASLPERPEVDEPPMSIPVESEDLAALAGIGAERRRRRRGLNPMAYAFIAMATAFGAVSAWFLFGDGRSGGESLAELEPTAQPQVPPSAEFSPPPPPSGQAAPEGTGEAASGTPAGSGDAMGKLSGKLPERTPGEDGKDPPPPTAKGSTPACDPDDPLCSSSGVAGPSAGKAGSGDGESGQGLTQSQASAVVAQYKGSLMRKCRALVTKGGAKVAATITVGSSGAVQSVSASGGNEYPGLASCVSSRIRNWTFPASGGSTTVNVSFNFL